jgi:hypothetical protein
MSLNSLLAKVLPRFPSVLPDSEVEVLKEVPVETLYLALKKTDLESMHWFYQHALPEQVQGIVDIDCWEGDAFLPERFQDVFTQMTSVSAVKLNDYMKRLDPEVIVRALLEWCEVLDFDPQEPPNVPEERLLFSPDSRYALVLTTDDPELREQIMQWMNRLATVDLDLLRRHLESCKWEQKSDLEEFGYRVKKGRLEEMGFVDRTEALALYATGQASELKRHLAESPLSPGTKRAALQRRMDDEFGDAPGFNEAFLPEAIAKPAFQEGFLATAFAKIEERDLRELLLAEFLRTLNASLAADGILRGPLEDITDAALRAREYIDLGLTYLSNAKSDDAALMLENYPMHDIFRLGWLLVQDLNAVAAEVRRAQPPALLGREDAEMLEALKGRHPVLDGAQLAALGITGRKFLSPESILTTGLRLQELRTLGTFFSKDLAGALALGERPLQEEESAYSRLATGFAREAGGLTFATTPLTAEEWTKIAPAFAAVRGPAELALRQAAQVVAQRVPEGARTHFIRRMDSLLEDAVAALRANPTRMPEARKFTALSLQKDSAS